LPVFEANAVDVGLERAPRSNPYTSAAFLEEHFVDVILGHAWRAD